MSNIVNTRDKTAIVGIGATEISRDCGRTELKMAVEAILDAVEDAGISVDDIDGMVNYTMDKSEQLEVVNALGIPNLSFFSKTPYGGGGSCATVAHAVAAVESGLANYVVCYRSIRDASLPVRIGDFDASQQSYNDDDVYYGMYMPYGLITPVSWVAMFAQRYIHEFDVAEDAFWPVAQVNRENANRNPNAWFHDQKLTYEEYMNSPMNVTPLRRHDCCLNIDGAMAVIVTSAENAKHLKQTPAYISGVAQGMHTQGEQMTSYYREDITTLHEVVEYGNLMFEMAGITPQDIDVAQFYDAFSPLVPMQLEALGFVEKGEGVDFIQDVDRLRVDGELPINTSGGLMSEGYVHGMNLIVEAVRQVRGTSTTQVNDVEHSLVTGGLGVPSSGIILRRG